MEEVLFFEGAQSAKYRRSYFFWWGLGCLVTLGVALIVFVPVAAVNYFIWKTTKYKISSNRIQIQSGIFSREIDSLELWRIQDILFKQGFVERLFGEGSLVLVTQDRVNPILKIGGIGAVRTRELFDKLQPAISTARKENKVSSISA